VVFYLFWLSTKGHRVIMARFYDIFLSQCKPDVVKLAYPFFEPEELIDGIFEGDVQLDYCVTPDSIYKF
jgi:5-formyltetrahydrofolate cyclo-ligase